MSFFFGADPRHRGSDGDSRPSWARRDTGPLNTYDPGPLPTEPLPNSYHAGTRLAVSAVIFALVAAFVVWRDQSGALGSTVWIAALWLVYAVPVWLRGRIGLRVNGDRCEVQGMFRHLEFSAEDVARVRYVFNGRSPNVGLVLRDGRTFTLIASRIERGHSTLFEWLRRFAPEVEYDRKALDLRDMLFNRGLIGDPDEPWTAPRSLPIDPEWRAAQAAADEAATPERTGDE